MVLMLNLIDTDHHRDYAVEILQQYGKVCLISLVKKIDVSFARVTGSTIQTLLTVILESMTISFHFG